MLVNFRDLSVCQLGSLYEELLERRPVARDGEVEAQLQPYAHKDTGSYYTPPELVRLIVEQTLGPLVSEREDAFHQLAQSLASDPAYDLQPFAQSQIPLLPDSMRPDADSQPPAQHGGKPYPWMLPPAATYSPASTPSTASTATMPPA